MEEEFTREQVLLKRLRDERCGGNAAELARQIGKDATYVNRLLYPAGKKGRKGIGLEVMRAASTAFMLPPGYWDGVDSTSAMVGTGEPGDAPAMYAQQAAFGRQYAQLLIDLEDLPPSRRSKLLDQIHQAAEEAREAAEHLRGKVRESAHATRQKHPAASTSGQFGDGNERQTPLPLVVVSDPFTAPPGEQEERLYERFGKTPKKAPEW